MLRRWSHTWHRAAGIAFTVGFAVLAVFNLAQLGFAPQTLLSISVAAMLAGGQLTMTVITRMAIVVKDGVVLVRNPLATTRVVPLGALSRVVHIPVQTAATKAVSRSVFVLVAADGSTIAVLADRVYQPNDLSALLALLPPVEHEARPRTMRDLRKSFKVSTRASVRDWVVLGVATLLAYAGLAGLVVAFIAISTRHATGR